MLRTEIKNGLLLFAFSLFMFEVLNLATISAVVIGLLCGIFMYRPNKWIRNIFALGIFISYWLTYGKVIDPEVGLNFLVTVIVLKLLEKESKRDEYMIFMGLLLVIAAGSLFERTFSYTIFFAVAFLFLIRDFYQLQKLSARLRDLGLLLLWILPLTFAMFFLVPRLMNPVPFKLGGVKNGEIGYSSNVNLSSMESLAANDTPAFQALVDRPLSQNELYWRGNTVSQTDGWNWILSPKDRAQGTFTASKEELGVRQEMRLFSKEEFLFALDRPISFRYRNETLLSSESGSSLQDRGAWIQRYQVISAPYSRPATEAELAPYLRPGLPKIDRQWIHDNFKGKSASELEEEVRTYFKQHEFSYTLNPGIVADFREFMTKKKSGLCSHYASALGLIMRTKGIPARLVSGFMGGAHNPFGGFYLISQNDAHAWVEVYQNGNWTRLDPTGWIAPDRILLGGGAYMSATQGLVFGTFKMSNWRALGELRLWLGQWDFKFYQWLEQVDYHGQEAWLLRLKFKREWFYALAPLLLMLFLGLYAWQFKRRQDGLGLTELDRLWGKFLKKLKARGIDLPLSSLKEAKGHLETIEHPEKARILEIWETLVEFSFAGKGNAERIKKELRRF